MKTLMIVNEAKEVCSERSGRIQRKVIAFIV